MESAYYSDSLMSYPLYLGGGFRKPAKRAGVTVSISIEDCDGEIASITRNSTGGVTESGQLGEAEMAARKIVVPAHGKSKSEGLINYAELVFDEQPNDKAK